MENIKTIKICTGVGLNQFFPEYSTIEIDTVVTDNSINTELANTTESESN
jgi:hypothetical protein